MENDKKNNNPIIPDLAEYSGMINSCESNDGDIIWSGTYKEWREYQRLEDLLINLNIKQ